MKKRIKILTATLVVMILFAFSLSFMGCSFPTELEDGRFYFTNARVTINEETFTNAGSPQLLNNFIRWVEDSLQTIRPQIPAVHLPIFDMLISMVSVSLVEEWHWITRNFVDITENNRGRFYTIRNSALVPSNRSWDWEQDMHVWTENQWDSNSFTLQNGRLIGSGIMYERTNARYRSYRAFTENRIVRSDNINFKYDFFDPYYFGSYFGIRNMDISGIRDFWISERLTFVRR